MFTDLATIQLRLRSQRTNTLPAWLGRATHAHFLNTLARINGALSEGIHDASGLKPFTASNLLDIETEKGMIKISPSTVTAVRYTTLHPHLTTLTINGLLPLWLEEGITLHDQRFEVVDVSLETSRYGSTTYAELIEQASEKNRLLQMNFSSPTAFKSALGHQLLLPDPVQVFGSLLSRWNAFAPVLMHEEIADYISEGIIILEHNIFTQTLYLEGRSHKLSGFMGSVTYQLQNDTPAVLRACNALAAFAIYSGVGMKTAQGMGQTRLVTKG